MSDDIKKNVRILVAEPISEVGLEELRRKFEVDYRPDLAAADLPAALASADALIVRSKTRVTAECIRSSPRLRIIGRAGVGYDNIDLDSATERGIVVMNVPDANTMAATEHTFALMLALVRKIPQAAQQMREQKWKRADMVGHELFEKTLGLVGFGRIGKEVAHRARAFGMTVLVFDPYVTEERAAKLGVVLSDLDGVLAKSDVISLHVPLTDATRMMIGADQLKRMKRSAYLINCARGGVIDEAALAEALGAGWIAGAALDVYPTEPPDFSAPLLAGGFPGLLCTPHLGASTEEAQEKVGVSIARQVASALLDEDFANSVNLPRIDPEELRQLRPFMRLGERMGAFLAQWVRVRVGRLELGFEGDVASRDVSFVERAVLKGFLGTHLEEGVTYVNAPKLAADHGLEIVQTRRPSGSPYKNQVTLANTVGETRHVLAGTLSAKGEPRLNAIDGFDLEMDLKGNILLFFHMDQPGVIGRVGTILGNSHINIGRMEVGRTGLGEAAIMVLTVDSELGDRVMANLRELEDIRDVRMISLDHVRHRA